MMTKHQHLEEAEKLLKQAKDMLDDAQYVMSSGYKDIEIRVRMAAVHSDLSRR